jgi:hypothetical protein
MFISIFSHLDLFVSCKIEQKTSDGLSNSSQMKFKNINCVRNSFWMAMHEHSTSERDLEFKPSVSQVASVIIWNILCCLLTWDYVPPFPPKYVLTL